MSMKERVARAIWLNLHGLGCWDRHASEYDRERFLGIAAAVLGAMRDPDHDITAAVVSPTQDRTETVRIWNAMIDRAREG